jgi:hypothetical protein
MTPPPPTPTPYARIISSLLATWMEMIIATNSGRYQLFGRRLGRRKYFGKK